METSKLDTVRSMMTGHVIAVTTDTTLETALRLMTEARVRHLPVMDGRRCVGLLHETDILWTLWTHGLVGRTAGDCCRKPAPAVGADDPVISAAARIDRSGGDAALVTVNESIVGILTAADIIHHLGERADG
jgi:CBS domain-containing protein